MTEGLQWQIIHPISSSCTWSIAAALARACGTQDVNEFEVMLEMLDFLDMAEIDESARVSLQRHQRAVSCGLSTQP